MLVLLSFEYHLFAILPHVGSTGISVKVARKLCFTLPSSFPVRKMASSTFCFVVLICYHYKVYTVIVECATYRNIFTLCHNHASYFGIAQLKAFLNQEVFVIGCTTFSGSLLLSSLSNCSISSSRIPSKAEAMAINKGLWE